MNRRQVLIGGGAVAAVACGGDDGDPTTPGPEPAPDRAPEPEPWAAPGAWDEAAFAWGSCSGDPAADGVLLLVRTTEPTVELVVMADVGGVWTEVERRAGLEVTDGVVQLALSGLSADTAHAWVATSADGARRTPVGRFRTSPGPDSWRKLVIGATSCMATDGNPRGFVGLGDAARENLDAFLLLGDTVYADGAKEIEDYRAFWREVASTAPFRDLCASTSVVATWDDHEVANNWVLEVIDGFNETVISPERLDTATQAFHEALPMRPGPIGALWRKVSFGPIADVFVLDCRGERAPGELVSPEQLGWIVGELGSSAAVFKLVMVSIHATDHSRLLGFVEETDRWQGYPDQRDALVAAAEAAGGVLFVTGDMHYGAIQKLSPAGEPGDGLWEVAAGPTGSELFGVATLVGLASEEVAAQYPFVADTWNWARLTLDPGLKTITAELVDDDGAVLGSQVIAFT